MLWSYNERGKYTIYIFYVYIYIQTQCGVGFTCMYDALSAGRYILERLDRNRNIGILLFSISNPMIYQYIIVRLAHGSYNHHNWKHIFRASETPDVPVNSVKVIVFTSDMVKNVF